MSSVLDTAFPCTEDKSRPRSTRKKKRESDPAVSASSSDHGFSDLDNVLGDFDKNLANYEGSWSLKKG